MKDWRGLWRSLKDIIDSSTVPEDPIHARNTLKWIVKLYPKADRNLKLAGFSHDIERAIPEKKVRRDQYPDYESFKRAHAKNSALIVADIMKKHKVCRESIEDVVYLIENHEQGGSFRANLLKDADSISFFDKNVDFYAKRHDLEETIRRSVWGYKRVSEERKEIVFEILSKKENPIFRLILERLLRLDQRYE
jgi:hypothetical protein